MAEIRVEPEHLYAAARSIWQANYVLLDELHSLRVAILRLEMAWQGGDAEEVIGVLNNARAALNARAEELYEFGQRLSRHAESWDESDQRWASIFSDSKFLQPGE
jgi:uncharacterized protein YukE